MQNVGGLTLETKVSYELTNRISDMLSINRWRCRHAVNQPMALQTCGQLTMALQTCCQLIMALQTCCQLTMALQTCCQWTSGVADMLSINQWCCSHAVNQPMALQTCSQSTKGIADMLSINQWRCRHAIN